MVHQMHADLDEADAQDQVNHAKGPGWELLSVVMPHDQHKDHDARSDELSTGFWLYASTIDLQKWWTWTELKTSHMQAESQWKGAWSAGSTKVSNHLRPPVGNHFQPDSYFLQGEPDKITFSTFRGMTTEMC